MRRERPPHRQDFLDPSFLTPLFAPISRSLNFIAGKGLQSCLAGIILFFLIFSGPLQAEILAPRIWADQILQQREGSPGGKTKIFLVAASSQNANFAQEILDQKEIWKKAGFKEEEIACYYIRPVQEEFESDLDQFLEIARDLKGCYPAEIPRLREDLLRSAKNKPDFLYLYISTHGQEPFDLKLKKADPAGESYPQYRRLARYPILNEYHITVESLPGGPAHYFEVLGAYRAGKAAEELFITPKILTDFLKNAEVYRDPRLLQRWFYRGSSKGK